MTVRLRNNSGGNDVELDVTAEQDDLGVYLSLVASTAGSVETAFDFYANDPAEIEDFFEMVDDARASYERLRKQA